MLKIMLPMILMLPLSSISMSWWMAPSSLIILSILMIFYIPSSSYLIYSSYAATDIISSMLIILTIWITALMFLASHKIFKLKNKYNLFYYATITLLMILTLCFSAHNMFMFYIWFEASLIPTLLLIMVWGYQPERTQASMYMMIYTVVASLPMILMITKVFLSSGHSSMTMNINMIFPEDLVPAMGWMIMIAGMLVKLPLFSVHLWLPKAHVEAPIAGSMILAAILLKLGGYGIMRLSSLFPYISKTVTAPITSIAIIGAALTSMICLRQPDLKSLIAYSSVGHMGLMVAGAISSSSFGMSGAMAMMIAHGLCSSAMFSMANINYELLSTRSLFLMKGSLIFAPILTMWWFLFTACNMAAPPTINLLSEILLMPAIMMSSMYMIIPLAFVSFFTAAYSLYMYTTISHGSTTSFSSPTLNIMPKDYTLFFMHLTPIILIITKPEMIMYS